MQCMHSACKCVQACMGGHAVHAQRSQGWACMHVHDRPLRPAFGAERASTRPRLPGTRHTHTHAQVINRNEEAFTKERKQDLKKVHRNYDPNLHQFEKAHEYTRALNAAKLDRVFAKPFVAALPHDDGVTALCRNPKHLNSLVSGAADGVIRIWDVAQRRPLRKLLGHTSAVRGLAFAPDGETVLSASSDCTIKLWKVPYAPLEPGVVEAVQRPVLAFSGSFAYRSIDHHWCRNQFVTAGDSVQVWDHERSEPLHTFSWGADTVVSARFNPAEPDVFATTGSDRSIALYDLRLSTPVRKLVMQTRCNALAWNPMEAFNFTVANEDCNLYSYDMRRFKSATCVHQVSACREPGESLLQLGWGRRRGLQPVQQRRAAVSFSGVCARGGSMMRARGMVGAAGLGAETWTATCTATTCSGSSRRRVCTRWVGAAWRGNVRSRMEGNVRGNVRGSRTKVGMGQLGWKPVAGRGRVGMVSGAAGLWQALPHHPGSSDPIAARHGRGFNPGLCVCRDGCRLRADRTRVCGRVVRPLGAHLPLQRRPQPRGLHHQAHAARLLYALQRRRDVRVQRVGRHERARVEG
eukprot:365622-Chlamydomonas_euryale.AAC.9